ncbi:hypothetical protein D5282_10790 [bacterium 1xD8-48]|jgi:hypothetical protein|nr:hypothetical protein [bacterium 1xD8-48]
MLEMRKQMKFIRKCPFFLLLLSTGLLFSVIGFGGLKNIYATQEYDPVTSPVLSVMFTALNDEIYPWQMFAEKGIMTIANNVDENTGKAGDDTESQQQEKAPEGADGNQEEIPSEDVSGNSINHTVKGAIAGAISDSFNEAIDTTIKNSMESGLAANDSEEFPKGRLAPLRESTREEYLNHISADIYGDVGVQRAAACEFATVDESYFDDALFIGDSRTVGLRDYTDLSEHADFYCETSLTIYKALTQKFKGKGTVEEALLKNTYGKIYIMVGVNELGQGTTENFMEEYTKVVDRIHELAPEAKIFIQGIMRVTGKKHNSDAIFNNNNINARNNAIATLADNEQFFYIDVNEVICDEEGNLNAEYTHDQLHLLGMYNDLWKEFLMTKGVN